MLFIILSLVMPLQVRADKLFTVYTVNYPLTYFAERIGGNHIEVIFPAPSGVDPAFWTPDAATVKNYQQADLILLNGADYEKWTRKVSLPMLRSVNTSRAFKDNLIHIESTVTHSHGPKGDHSHGGTAFTTWLDFSQAIQQAEAIYSALARRMPDHKTDFAKNFEALQNDLRALDEQMTALSSRKPEIPLVASHPIYQYMARRYNLNLKMVMWEPDLEPDQHQWQELEQILADHQAAWMIWEGEPLLSSSGRLKNIGVKSLVFSPCFSKASNGDFLSVMEQNISNISRLFE